MAASSARIGYGAQLARQAANLTTIAGAITASGSPQAVTPVSMTSIAIGALLMIDTGAAATVKETVKVTATTGSTFTAIFRNNHSGGMSIALMAPVAELVSVGMPALKMDPSEATHLLSDNSYREYLAGVRDGGEVPFEANQLAADATQTILNTDFDAGTRKTWCVSLGGTPGNDNQAIWQFDGYVTALAPVARVEDVVRFSGSMKVSGKSFLYG